MSGQASERTAYLASLEYVTPQAAMVGSIAVGVAVHSDGGLMLETVVVTAPGVGEYNPLLRAGDDGRQAWELFAAAVRQGEFTGIGKVLGEGAATVPMLGHDPHGSIAV